jgi:hypothetical protein
VNSVSKNELKEVSKILKMSEIKFTPNSQEKVRAIENYVKKNFNFTEESDEKFENIESIVKVGALNDEGALRILYHLFDQSGIEIEIVITSNRFKTPFEKDFESYVFLTDYLIYLPQLDLFISPFGQFFRAGLVPYGYIENHGLFIKKVSIGDIKTGAGKVKFIPAKPSSETQSNIVINAKLDNSLDSLVFSYKLSYTGYYAQNIQPYFEYIGADKIKEFEESVLKSSLKDDITIKSLKIENKGIENLLVKPLVYNGEVSSNYFINKAGKKLLLKFGDLIGPQAELYQEVNRNLPIENDFNREYHREIVFTIPDNYVIKNPNDLIFNIQPFKNDNNAAEFVSSYKIEGNKLTVKIDEYYKLVKLPVSSYEKFREVVNAAANFNKVVLVMEMKQ